MDFNELDSSLQLPSTKSVQQLERQWKRYFHNSKPVLLNM